MQAASFPDGRGRGIIEVGLEGVGRVYKQQDGAIVFEEPETVGIEGIQAGWEVVGGVIVSAVGRVSPFTVDDMGSNDERDGGHLKFAHTQGRCR